METAQSTVPASNANDNAVYTSSPLGSSSPRCFLTEPSSPIPTVSSPRLLSPRGSLSPLPPVRACLSITSFSTVLSEGPICRICHEGEKLGEALISPCHCTGTMCYHRRCIEQWLATANSNNCDVCQFEYRTQRKPRPLLEWLRRPSQSNDRRNLLGDFFCFLILTPLVSVSSWLCLNGAQHYIAHRGHGWEATGLIGLTVILLMIYAFWAVLSLRYHVYVWKMWKTENQIVRLEYSQRNPHQSEQPADQSMCMIDEIYITDGRETQV
ncbi:E3 ubiquitin-protein ligase MARCHF2-like [Saccoglossus kowalevskii]|uniref:E3 ubiquitin-protein ligase MARCH3-like n=1 Tax=Saccoglossus kowalevskii TaxID=10224 RepID=A0ABM0M9R3_SACKO|nr:PREDICTED: E3 ubiquitin-protein ligase MARCH3-like [Saccoglossus kowalevskii]